MPATPKVSPAVKAATDRVAAACLGVRLPWRERVAYWVAYLGLARRGEQVYSPTEDAVYADGFWKRRFDAANERLNRRLAAARPETVEAPRFRRDELTAADFTYLDKARIPYVLEGGADGLPVRDWTLDHLEEVGGDCDVPINGAADRPSSDTSRPTKAHHYYDFHTGPLREVIESIRAGGNLRTTVAEDVMHLDDERLMRELDVQGWERVSGWAENQKSWLKRTLCIGKIFSAQLIVQPPNAFTLWHAEPGDSFFVLAKGTKLWTLAHPRYTAGLRPRVKRTTNYTGSSIDIREPEAALRARGFDGYFGIPKVRVPLVAGDMLRVPNFWWHTVETSPGEATIASTMRVEPGPNLTAPAMFALRMMDEQTHTMMKSYREHGRVYDWMIGYPRRSRTQEPLPDAQATPSPEPATSRDELQASR